MVSVFRAPPEVAGQRLDIFMRSQLHRSSRTRTQLIVRKSAYDAAGRPHKPRDRVRAEQSILLWREPWDETLAPIEVPVLYEDSHILAVDKPALLAVHPTARYHRNTLIKILQAARPDCAFLSLGHRLDRETSGVLLVSKTRACDRALKRLLERRTGVKKTYFAITWGTPNRGDGATTFRFERRMELDPDSPLGVKMRIRDAADALAASTVIDVQEVRTAASGRAYSLVRCGLETGRQLPGFACISRHSGHPWWATSSTGLTTAHSPARPTGSSRWTTRYASSSTATRFTHRASSSRIPSPGSPLRPRPGSPQTCATSGRGLRPGRAGIAGASS